MLPRALFPLNEHDTDLGFVTPDSLARPGRLACEYEIKYFRNADRSLNFQTRASLGHIPNRARDRMLPEKDLPGLQHSPSRRWLASFHKCSLLWVRNQSEMRGWIAGVNRIADFSKLFQKFNPL
jgi:hypothetical protein